MAFALLLNPSTAPLSVRGRTDYLKVLHYFFGVVGLTRIPHRTKISTALKQFPSDPLKALSQLNSDLVTEELQSLELMEITHRLRWNGYQQQRKSQLGFQRPHY
jgi:hypothetical protein